MYGSWDIERDGQKLLSLYTIFCPFTPLTTWKIKIWDIIILNKCTKNHDHMLYCSWDMTCDRCYYFSFWAIFCPFIKKSDQKADQKIKIKKIKKHQEIHHFTKVYQKSWSYAIVFLKYGAWQINYFSFWAIFCPFIKKSDQKADQKIKIKKIKKHQEIHHFTKVYQKSWSYATVFLKYGAWQM